MAHSIPQIRAFLGSDPTVMDGKTVSGFEKFSSAYVEGLLQMIQDEARFILEKAPQELVDATIPNPFLLPIFRKQLPPRTQAVLRVTGSTRIYEHTDASTLKLAGYRLPQYKAIIISPDETHEIGHMRMKIGHEIMHILTRFGLQAYMKAPMEALISRTEKACYGINDLEAGEWEPSTFLSTTGFCPPDYANVQFGGTATECLYLHAHRDAEMLSDEQLWGIWTTLNTHALRTGMTPTVNFMKQTIVSHAHERGEEMLTRPSFRPFILGNHVGIFGKTENRVKISSFQVLKRSDFNRIIPDVIPQAQEVLFDVPDVPQRFDIRFIDTKGAPIESVKIKGNDTVSTGEFNFPEIIRQAASQPLINQTFWQRGIRGAEITAEGFPTIQMQFGSK